MVQSLHAPEEIDYASLAALLQAAETDQELFKIIVNAPFRHLKVETAFLFLGIMVLLLVDKEAGTINRIALSNTDLAKATKEVSAKKFEDIKIPLGHRKNVIARAIDSGEPHTTIDWHELFVPALTASQAQVNQANAGIAYSAIYPFTARDGGALIFSYYQYPENIGEAQKEFMERYAALVNAELAG
jgi:hypothetical protein